MYTKTHKGLGILYASFPILDVEMTEEMKAELSVHSCIQQGIANQQLTTVFAGTLMGVSVSF